MLLLMSSHCNCLPATQNHHLQRVHLEQHKFPHHSQEKPSACSHMVTEAKAVGGLHLAVSQVCSPDTKMRHDATVHMGLDLRNVLAANI